MGKLNIAHHKSYHPYRRDNIEKVRRDEEQAKLEESLQNGKVLVADAEARMEILRSRASASAKPDKRKIAREEEEMIAKRTADVVGHVNLFEDLEMQQVSGSRAGQKKKEAEENDRGIPLAPSEKDLKPWYSSVKGDERKTDNRKMAREMNRKSVADPLTSIKSQLATSSPSSSRNPRRIAPPADDPREARLNRESSERQRAMELIARKKREMAGSETPSVRGYGDMYNRADVEEAQRRRGR